MRFGVSVAIIKCMTYKWIFLLQKCDSRFKYLLIQLRLIDAVIVRKTNVIKCWSCSLEQLYKKKFSINHIVLKQCYLWILRTYLIEIYPVSFKLWNPFSTVLLHLKCIIWFLYLSSQSVWSIQPTGGEGAVGSSNAQPRHGDARLSSQCQWLRDGCSDQPLRPGLPGCHVLRRVSHWLRWSKIMTLETSLVFQCIPCESASIIRTSISIF